MRAMTTILVLMAGCVPMESDDAGDPTETASSEVISGTLVTANDPVYTDINRAVVGLDAIAAGPNSPSFGTGLLVGPRLVLTASHNGKNGLCGVTGQSVEFGVDTVNEDEQVAVVEELDYPGSCAPNPRCCYQFDNNVDLALWVLEHPPAVAVPYWRPSTSTGLPGVVHRFGFGPGSTPGKLRSATCQVGSGTYHDPFNGTRFDSTACLNGALAEGGDSGGPVFDANQRLLGVHIGSGYFPNQDQYSIAMHMSQPYRAFIEYYLGEFEAELVIGDYDGDGARDFFHWNDKGHGNWVDMNEGTWPDGGGEPGLSFTWCSRELHVGDFNGDGRDDLLCHDAPGSTLQLRYGAAAGGVGSNVTFASTWCGDELFVGDFDGDGYDDLLCREPGAERKIKLNTQGANPFPGTSSSWTESFGWCGQELYVADFDGDQRDDVLCRNPGVALYVRHGTSAGTLGSSSSLATTWCGQQLLVADFSGDGRSDLMCLDQVGDAVRIDYASAATFPFAGQSDWSDSTYAFCGQHAQAADVDGDGKADVVCHDPASGVVWVDKTTSTLGGFDGVTDAKMPSIQTPLWP